MPPEETVLEETEVVAETTETPTEEETPATKQWAALVKKEGEVTRRSQEIKAAEAKIKEATDKYGGLFKAAAKFNEDPTAILTALKIDPKTMHEVLSKHLETNGSTPPASPEVVALVKRIDELEGGLAEEKKAATEQATAASIQAQEEQYTGFLKQHAEKDKEKYELVATADQYGLVMNVIKEHWAATEGTQDPLTPDEALGMVEEYLREDLDKQLETSYAKGKFGSQSSEEAAPPGKKPPRKKLETVGTNLAGEASETALPLTSDARWKALKEKHFPGQPKPTPRIPSKKGKKTPKA